uniref:Uncharacterized protein n=1 Tax=Steinernema glaseri TaxID=37863 RepID=A0A1I7Z1Z6_9BILA
MSSNCHVDIDTPCTFDPKTAEERVCPAKRDEGRRSPMDLATVSHAITNTNEAVSVFYVDRHLLHRHVSLLATVFAVQMMGS